MLRIPTHRLHLFGWAALLAHAVAVADDAAHAPRCAATPRPGCPALVAEARTLRVVFAPTATEGQLRAALTRVSARIVGGPTPLGEYWLASSSASLDEVRAAMVRSGLTTFIEVDLAGPPGP